VPEGVGAGAVFATLAAVEKQHILAALEHCKGNRTRAAELLDISIRTLRNKLNEYSGKTRDGSEEAEETEANLPA
jgi:two-component system response regulator FlrC